MSFLFDYYEHFLKFLERGGPVITAILVVSIIMWTLIIERYWFMYRVYPSKVKEALAIWNARADRSSWYAQRVRQQLIGQVAHLLRQNVPLIKALVTVLPFLGLLGTVSGMITSFEVLRVFGTDNARGLTAGIAEALFTVLTGLLTALSGLYFSLHLQQLAARERQQLTDILALTVASEREPVTGRGQ